VRRAILTLCTLLLTPRIAAALNPSLDVSQYVHTSWRVRDGFWSGAITAIAQTPDGYLWVGTDSGLFRFDGVRSAPWPAPPNQTLPSEQITNLLAGRDGTLWIATDKGLASWKDAKLRQYQDLAGVAIGKMVEARDGSVWITAARYTNTTWMLCTIQAGRVACYGGDGGPGTNALGLYEDRTGALWVGTADGLWHWQPNPRRFYPLSRQANGIQGLAETDDGAVLISMAGGLRRLRDGRAEMAYQFPASMQNENAYDVLRDRDGGLWVGTSARGLVHVHQGVTDVFAEVDGLSGNRISGIVEDREGSIWVATLEGLDRFRAPAAVVFTPRQGLPAAIVQSVLAASDGSVWVGTGKGVSRLMGNRVITGDGLPAAAVASLYQDRRGRVWISTRDGVGYVENDRFVAVRGLPGGMTRAIVEDSGSLWVVNQDLGLYEVSADNRIIRNVPWTEFDRNRAIRAVAANRSKPGLWLGFGGGDVINVVDGRRRASYGVADGLAGGIVRSLRVDDDETLWIASDNGLSRLKRGRFATLTATGGLPCDAAQWVSEDVQWFWIGMGCGLVRIARSDMDAWGAAVDNGISARPGVRTRIFGISDGVGVLRGGTYFSAPAMSAADGRLWFISRDGVSMVDPHQLPFNTSVPPVHIEQVTADRKSYDAATSGIDGLRLPPHTRDLQIDYTALSLAAPEKMQFRYQLEGRDQDWQNAGTRRQAFYTNLAPKNYRFRVIASNNDGVWNEAGAVLDLSILPAYYQTTWFRAASVAAVVAVLFALYQRRVRQVAREFDARLQARVDERTRIARELHDTLLQNFHGVTFRFQAASNVLPDRPVEAKRQLEIALESATLAIREGRNAVQGLRGSTMATNDLAVALGTLGEELAATPTNDPQTPAATLDVSIHGTPRTLRPIVRDDIYRIGSEAMRNAFRHARARRVEVELRYDDRQFQLRVRDDGRGIDASGLHTHPDGHFGLPGMRERAELISGHLEVWSQAGMGTEVALTIPGAAVYATPTARRHFWSFGRERGDA